MRGNGRYRRPCYGSWDPEEEDAHATYVTNVTNVTNVKVTNVNTGGVAVPYKWHGQSGRRRHKREDWHREERKPKLLRYCASCGLLDQHVVARMSHEEACLESMNVLGYAAKGLVRDLDCGFSNASRHAAGACRNFGHAVSCFYRAFKMLFS